MGSKGYKEWIVKALDSVGHPDPTSVAHSYICDEEGIRSESANELDYDQQFHNLTIWLEDRVIRQWDMDQRERLRKNFWEVIDEYLKDLECPKSYMTIDCKKAWWNCRDTRRRVAYWLLSCAVSESYAENITEQEAGQQRTSGQPRLESAKLESLPLGFSTGDSAVDGVLKIVRMRHLLEIEHQQRQQNALLAKQIQQRAQEQVKKETQTTHKPRKKGKRK